MTIDTSAVCWEPTHKGPDEDPRLHIYADGDARINAAAGRRWFDEYEVTDMGVDADAGLVILDPGGDRSPLTIHREDNEHGAEVSSRSRVRQLLDLDDLEETVRVPLEERDGYVVGDVGAELKDDAGPVSKGSEAIEASGGTEGGNEPDEDAAAESDTTDEAESAALPFAPEYTSCEAVERHLATKLAEYDAVTVTAADVAEAIDEHPTYVGRVISDLGKSPAPVKVQRSNHDDPNETTEYHVSLRAGPDVESQPDEPPTDEEADEGGDEPSQETTPDPDPEPEPEAEPEPDADADVAEPESDDKPGYIDLDALGCSEMAILNAVTGATTVLDVQRELGLDRDRTAEMLAALGLLEGDRGLDNGRGPVEQSEVRAALRGVEVRE